MDHTPSTVDVVVVVHEFDVLAERFVQFLPVHPLTITMNSNTLTITMFSNIKPELNY